MDEYLPLVDETGEVIGKALRSQVHGNPRLMHPVVHLHVFDKAGRILFQRRSQTKDLFPGYWDTAVGGHVGFGEAAQDALRREAEEELGVPTHEAKYLYTYIMRNQYETEYVTTWAVEFEGPFAVNADEVAEIRFFSPTEIEDKLGKDFFTPNAEEEVQRLKGSA